jgi:hypothetical protein
MGRPVMSARTKSSLRCAALALALGAAALGTAGCRDKSNAAAPDGGDSALLARPATDGGASADGGAPGAPGAADSGVTLEDLAMPPPSTEELSARMRHLLEAVTQNEPDLANDVVFPRDAFIATRDTPDPQQAWEKKQSNAFRRAVERNHKRTKGIENAKFVGFELGHVIVQATPKKNEWKRPLWRVKHSKLSFTIDGKPRHFDINEMTAWRGAWYVTRLR